MFKFIFLLTNGFSFLLLSVATDPELAVDTSNWVDPNDPFEVGNLELRRNCRCDCGEELEKYKNALYEKSSHVKELESRLHKKHENFTKLLLSDIFQGINVDISLEDYVFKRGDVTLTRNGINILRRFFAEPEPNDVLKASLQLEMKTFISEVGEVRENPIVVRLRGLVPYLAGANAIIIVFVVFHYGIFKNRKAMLLMLFCGFYVAEVARTVNKKYKEAMARRLAQDLRRGEHPCAPKSYFTAAMESFSSMFVKTEDDCYKFYRDSMVDVELDVRILSSAFSVLGETLGSFFVGLSGAIKEAVEDYFSPAPIYVQIIKMFVFIILVIAGIILTLKFCQLEIEIPFLKIRWNIGQGIGYRDHQEAIIHYQNDGQYESIALKKSRYLTNRSRSHSRTRLGEITDADTIFHDAQDSCEISNTDPPVLNSPNITPRSEARKKHLSTNSESR